MAAKDAKYEVSINITMREIGKDEPPMFEHADTWSGLDYIRAVMLEEIIQKGINVVYDGTIELGYEGAKLLGQEKPRIDK
jgi:hypothetical protein